MDTADQSERLSRVNRWLQEFRHLGAVTDGGITRLGYTDVEQMARDKYVEMAKSFGLEVRVDGAANVIARRPGERNDLPAVACGSHLDTVVNGGGYDGALGSLAALEVAARLHENRMVTKRPIEFIVFASEESSRFGVATIGSKAMAGVADLNVLKKLTDNDGVSFEEALNRQGLSISSFASAKRRPGELAAFLELHIEQGPVLETRNVPIGVVTGIAAPTRLKMEVSGQSAHSGTTSMDLRHDALLTAAELTLLVERLAKEPDSNCVGTVGVLNVFPNTANTVPGRASMIVDIRSADIAAKSGVVRDFLTEAAELAAARGVQITSTLLSDETPVPLNERIQHTIRQVCDTLDYPYLDMVSGAGHDAMNMAALCPCGMLFVPSVGGLSHTPHELTLRHHIDMGTEVLYQTVLRLANSDVE